MKLSFLFISMFMFALSSNAFAELSIKARSIADHCQFIYRIQTEFKIFDNAPAKAGLVFWLQDRYTEEFLAPEFVPFIANEGSLTFNPVTMSTNPKYLAHEIFFAYADSAEEIPEKPTHKANFSALMSHCFDLRHRDQAPFQKLEIGDTRLN